MEKEKEKKKKERRGGGVFRNLLAGWFVALGVSLRKPQEHPTELESVLVLSGFVSFTLWIYICIVRVCSRVYMRALWSGPLYYGRR